MQGFLESRQISWYTCEIAAENDNCNAMISFTSEMIHLTQPVQLAKWYILIFEGKITLLSG